MKFYLGYLFERGIDIINALGINEWCINEGIADKFDLYTVTKKQAHRFSLSVEESDNWFKRNTNNSPSPQQDLSIQQKLNTLLELSNNIPFVEHYTHEKESCYKINNPYTEYRKEVIVLGTTKTPFTEILDVAINYITKAKKEWEE